MTKSKNKENFEINLSNPKKIQFALLATAMTISVCGISYELLSATISNYFLGNAVFQYSLTIGVFLFAMGIGSYLSGKFEKSLLERFILIEIIIGLVGGFSTLILFTAYRYTASFSLVMYLLLLLLGTLIGLEIPLLIRILKDYKALKFSIADILSFDYVGALIASILFPMFVLPYMGMMHASFFYAILNMVIVFFNISIFEPLLKKPKKYFYMSIVVTIILFTGLAFSSKMVTFFDSKLYDDEVILTKQTKYQRIVLTKFKEDMRLFLDGNLQFSSWDEYRYHECLVHPAMALSINQENVLILGGGDGLAAREILKYPDIDKITLVDIDKDMVELCKTDPNIKKLNQNALSNPKVQIVIDDAYKYLVNSNKRFGVIIVDLPDPNNESLSKLYTISFYQLIKQHLAKGGIASIQSTSPYFARTAYWCIFKTIQKSGLYVKPFHAYVPSMGDWGFTMASNVKINIDKLKINIPTKFLNNKQEKSLFIFPKDSSEVDVKINTLNTHNLLKYYENEWKKWE